MKPNDYAQLEKDKGLKKQYVSKTLWWKNIRLIAPICFLFAGLIGILYLFNYDKLVSWYVIPYLAIFVIGTIMLKAVKKHLQQTIMATPDSFLVCIAKSFAEKDGYTYTAFTKDSHRHNKYYITDEIKNADTENLLIEYEEVAKKESILISNNIYIRAFRTREITKRYPAWRDHNAFPILYIDDKYTFVMKKADFSSGN